MKIFLMLLVALGAWWLLRGLFRGRVSENDHRQDQVRAPFDQNGPQESMVACAHCQLHLPGSEAVWSEDKAFCGEAHLRAYVAEQSSRQG